MPQELPAKKGEKKKTKNFPHSPSKTMQNPYLPLKRILFFLQRNLPSCPKLHELELTWSGTFCPTDSPKILWKTQPWNRLSVTALPTFHGLNLPKHPEKQSKKLQNLSQLHPSAHSCYPAKAVPRDHLCASTRKCHHLNVLERGPATHPVSHLTTNYHLLQHESFQLQYLPKHCICN